MRIHPPLNNPRMSTWSRLIMIEIPMTMIQIKKGILSQGSRLPARTIVQGHGRDKEIVVLHIEQSDEFRGMIPKSSDKSTSMTTATSQGQIYHSQPLESDTSILSHGAAKEDLQNEIMPLVTLYRCDATAGDANKSANTYSKLQHVYNPTNGLVNILMRTYQRLWNETKNLPLVDRMEYAMETSCTLKSIVRHHLYMKCGSGFDRTFPDVMMTIVFRWGKTNIQQDFRKDETNGMDDEQLEFTRNHQPRPYSITRSHPQSATSTRTMKCS